MKHLFIAFVFLFTFQTVFAQPTRVLTASNSLWSNNFEKAKEDIDKAIQHKKTSKEAKTWYYRAKIYRALSERSSQNYTPEQKMEFYDEVLASCINVKNLDSRGIYKVDIEQICETLNNVRLNDGIQYFNKEDYNSAIRSFENSFDFAQVNNQFDTIALFNIGLTYERVENYSKALEIYKKCIQFDYKNGEIYTLVSSIYQQQGDNQSAENILNEGLEKHPKNSTILTSLLNIHILNDSTEKAFFVINKAIDAEPENGMYYYVRATLKEKLKEPSASIITDYEKAIQLKTDYADAYYNLGAHYMSLGAELSKTANKQEDYELASKFSNQAKMQYIKAIPYLEKARVVQPNNRLILSSLKQLYGQLGEITKYKEVKDALKMLDQ